MKKCPYCAEEIRDAAIVCRYCGRDLNVSSIPPTAKSVTETKLELPTPEQKTIWRASRPAAIVITVLYVFSTFVTAISPNDLLYRLTLGLLVTLFGWWTICALVVWLWRRVGVGGFILIGGVAFVCYLLWDNQQKNSFAAVLTPTPFPTPAPIPTATKARLVRVSTPTPISCLKWDEVTRSMDGQETCVYGVVANYKENWEFEQTNFYFGSLEEFFFVSNYRWNDVAEGDCVAATGVIQLNTYKTPYIKVNELFNCEPWMR